MWEYWGVVEGGRFKITTVFSVKGPLGGAILRWILKLSQELPLDAVASGGRGHEGASTPPE